MFANRVKNIQESPTALITAKAIQMKRDKIDIVDLTIGEPDFPTPQNIKAAGKNAIDRDLIKYTMVRGMLELRQAIAQKLQNENGVVYHADEIIVTNGAKQAILNTILTLIDRGDEVIIPAPYWVSYPEMVTLAEGKAVIVPTREADGFKLTAENLRAVISPKTKAIILCNPSNPTGALYTRNELDALAAVIIESDLFVIADEIYEKLVYDTTPFVSFPAVHPALKQKTILINGFSKAYAMTGWRLGYAAGAREVIETTVKIQSHSTTNASTIAQYAGIEALNGPQEDIEHMRRLFEERRNFMHSRLSAMKGISCQKPGGAFYAFPNVAAYYGSTYQGTQINNSSDIALYLLNEAKVLLIPGVAFGSDDHLRISYSSSMERLEEGMQRMENALGNLLGGR